MARPYVFGVRDLGSMHTVTRNDVDYLVPCYGQSFTPQQALAIAYALNVLESSSLVGQPKQALEGRTNE